jgi:hypothetical protein
MTWYSPYNSYSNQLQYYYPYSYSSYRSTLYGTVDGGANHSDVKAGFKTAFGVVKTGVHAVNWICGDGLFGFSELKEGSSSKTTTTTIF